MRSNHERRWLTDSDFTVPDSIESLQAELTKLIKEHWELDKAFKIS